MDKIIARDAKGNITDGSVQSAYFATEAERNITALTVKDYIHGNIILNRTRREYNDRSIIQETDMNQRAFNSWVPPRSEDPDESWRAQTVRPLTRNKLISIAAHATATILYPAVFAVNDQSQEDKDAAFVMKSLIEWVIENSNYKSEFLNAVISALVDPAVIVQVEYANVMRTVRFMQQSGAFTVKEIVDEVLSGFHMYIVPVRQLLIANFFESNIQRQRFLIRNRYIDYADAKAIWGTAKNFQYVKPGVRAVFDMLTQTFYDQRDLDLMEYMVNEVTYYNRSLDLEIVFVNGIIVTETDRPNPRLDKLYPFAKSGYEPINNGVCFYYKSCANKLGSDQDIVDTLYNMILDGTFITLMPPVAIYGSEEINSSVYIPGTSISFKDPNSKMEAFAPKIDLRAGLESIQKVESSMSESSQDDLMNGDQGGGPAMTARQTLLIEQNARIAMGLFGKMIGQLVEDIGHLMMGDIVQYMTVGEVTDIGSGSMKFKTFLLPNKTVDGKKVTHRIEFSNPITQPAPKTEQDLEDNSFKLYEREGGLKGGSQKIYQVNPELFRELKYKVTCNVDDLTPRSKALEKALNLELYDRGIQNPIVDQQALTRDFLFGSYDNAGDNDKYIKKTPSPSPGGGVGIPGGNPTPNGGTPASPAAATKPNQPIQQKGVNTNLVSQLTGGNSLGVSASSSMK